MQGKGFIKLLTIFTTNVLYIYRKHNKHYLEYTYLKYYSTKPIWSDSDFENNKQNEQEYFYLGLLYEAQLQ